MDLTSATQRTLAILNASAIDASTYPSVSNDPRFPTGHVQAMLASAAREILGYILDNPYHPQRRTLLTTSSGLASAAAIPAHFGPISGVKITKGAVTRPGIFDPQWRTVDTAIQDLATGLLEIQPFLYAIDGQYLYHTGDTATVDYVPLAVSNVDATAVAAVPGEYENAVIAIALSYLFAFEGADIQAAGYFNSIVDGIRNAIRMAQPLPPIQLAL